MSLPSCDFLKFSHCFFSPCYTRNRHALNFHQEPDLPTTCPSGVPAAPNALAAAYSNHLLTSAAVLTSHPSYTSIALRALTGIFYLISKWPNHHFLPSNSDDSQRRQWQPTPVLLPGNSHGRRSLVGCSPWGRKESDTTERLHFHFSLSCTGEGNGNPLQCWPGESRDVGAWWAAVYGVAQSRTRLKWLSRDAGVRKSCRLRRQAAWFNPDSLLASFFTSLKPTFPQAFDKDNHSTYFRVFSNVSMSNGLKALNPVQHTGNANINNKDINNDDKQVSLRTNFNLQSTRFSRTSRFIFLLFPTSFSLRNTDCSFDVCCHPSWCNSFKTSQLAGFNGIHFPDCTLHWDTALLHAGVRETEQTLLGSQLCFLLAWGPWENYDKFYNGDVYGPSDEKTLGCQIKFPRGGDVSAKFWRTWGIPYSRGKWSKAGHGTYSNKRSQSAHTQKRSS